MWSTEKLNENGYVHLMAFDWDETTKYIRISFWVYELIPQQFSVVGLVQCGQHIFPTLPFTRRNRLSRNSFFFIAK